MSGPSDGFGGQSDWRPPWGWIAFCILAVAAYTIVLAVFQ